MKKLSLETLTAVSDELFEFQRRMFKETGGLPPQVLGLRLKNGRISHVKEYELEQPYRETVSAALRKAQKVDDVVVSSMETWNSNDKSYLRASDDPLREESVMLVFYSEGSVYTMSCPIRRNPDDLVKGDLEEVQSLAGSMTPSGSRLDSAGVKQLQAHMARALREQKEGWESEVSRNLHWLRSLAVLEQGWLPLTEPDLNQRALDWSHRQFNQFLNWKAFDHKHHWLVGVQVRLDPDVWPQPPSESIVVRELFAELLVGFDELAGPGQSFSVVRLEQAPALIYGYVPAMLLDGVLLEHSAKHLGIDRSHRHLEEMTSKQEESRWSNPVRAEGILDALLLVVVSLPGEDETLDFYEPGWRTPGLLTLLGEVQAALQKSAATLDEKMRVGISVGAVLPVYDAQLALYKASVWSDIAESVRLARSLPASEPVREAKDLYAEVSQVFLEEPTAAEFVVTLLWSTGSKFPVPVQTQRLPHQTLATLEEEVLQHLAAIGVEDVRRAGKPLRTKHFPRDPVTHGRMYPDAQGGWFLPQDIIAPGSKDVVRQLFWVFNPELENDPVVNALPTPHRLARQGLGEAMGQHFSPALFKAYRQLAADTSISPADLWDALKKQFPAIEVTEAARPHSVRPPMLFEQAFRVQASKAPTLFIRRTLTQRLAHTSIDLDIPVSLFHPPHALCYVHFEAPSQTVEWWAPAVEGSDPDAPPVRLELEGAFVHAAQKSGRRHLLLLLLAQGVEDRSAVFSQDIELDVEDETLPLRVTLENWAKAEGLPLEGLQELLPAVEELAKVLLYLGLRDSRLVENPMRSVALREAAGKKMEKQLKVLHKARGLFDHILVGPEQAMPTTQGLTSDERTMPVHVRRGFLNKFWTGKGRSVLKIRFIEPVVVNKRLLGDGSSGPAPKDIDAL